MTEQLIRELIDDKPKFMDYVVATIATREEIAGYYFKQKSYKDVLGREVFWELDKDYVSRMYIIYPTNEALIKMVYVTCDNLIYFIDDIGEECSLERFLTVCKQYEGTHTTTELKLTPRENSVATIKQQEYVQEMIKSIDKDTLLVIAMEELAELQQQVSKLYRGKGDTEHLAEEMADVCICLDLLMKISGVTEEQLALWIDKKMERNHQWLVKPKN